MEKESFDNLAMDFLLLITFTTSCRQHSNNVIKQSEMIYNSLAVPCHLTTTLKFFNVKKHVETLSVQFTGHALLKMIKVTIL